MNRIGRTAEPCGTPKRMFLWDEDDDFVRDIEDLKDQKSSQNRVQLGRFSFNCT